MAAFVYKKKWSHFLKKIILLFNISEILSLRHNQFIVILIDLVIPYATSKHKITEMRSLTSPTTTLQQRWPSVVVSLPVPASTFECVCCGTYSKGRNRGCVLWDCGQDKESRVCVLQKCERVRERVCFAEVRVRESVCCGSEWGRQRVFWYFKFLVCVIRKGCICD